LHVALGNSVARVAISRSASRAAGRVAQDGPEIPVFPV
jgi:hypothetical protein